MSIRILIIFSYFFLRSWPGIGRTLGPALYLSHLAVFQKGRMEGMLILQLHYKLSFILQVGVLCSSMPLWKAHFFLFTVLNKFLIIVWYFIMITSLKIMFVYPVPLYVFSGGILACHWSIKCNLVCVLASHWSFVLYFLQALFNIFVELIKKKNLNMKINV